MFVSASPRSWQNAWHTVGARCLFVELHRRLFPVSVIQVRKQSQAFIRSFITFIHPFGETFLVLRVQRQIKEYIVRVRAWKEGGEGAGEVFLERDRVWCSVSNRTGVLSSTFGIV